VLSATRGARGGYRLARPAERIRLIEVVEPFEGKRVRPGCLFRPGQPCRESGACSVHASWTVARRGYMEWLEKSTVADIRGGP
jgi:Rrf2 family protein